MKPEVQYLLECYTGNKIFEDHIDSTERSTEAWNPVQKTYNVARIADIFQGVAEIRNQAAEIRNEVELNAHQREKIRDVVRTLKTAADSFQIRPIKSLLTVEKAIMQNEKLDENELQVVRNIHSIGTTTNISQIAEYLKESLTSHTIEAAIRFICYSASSIPEEIAAICELARVMQPKIQQSSHSSSVYDIISEFIGDKLDAIIH